LRLLLSRNTHLALISQKTTPAKHLKQEHTHSKMKHLIIGGGPVGTYAAWKLAARGDDTTLIEEHPVIGAPVQCTGILTHDILKYMPRQDLKNVTKTIVTRTVIHSPHDKVELRIQPNYVIDNVAYCQQLARKAEDKGATILTRTRYISNTTKKITIKDLRTSKSRQLTTDHLIGADGPQSTVAKKNKINNNQSHLIGIQTVMKMKEYDDRIHFYPHIGAYAWYCPEGEGRARIGIAAPKNARSIFNDFIKRFKGRQEGIQGGPLPLYKPRPRVQRSYEQGLLISIIGDAVPFIKNTTGGGIVPGTRSAHIMAENPQTYPKNIGPLKRELHVHHLIHTALQRFTSKEWDKLIAQVKDPRVQQALKKTSRDNALQLAVTIIIRKPSLLRWSTKLL